MKKPLQLFIAIFISTFFITHAQNPVEYQVPSEDFPDMASVVDYINTHGAGSDGRTFVIAGDSEFHESPLVITGTGSEDAPITIIWNGLGQRPVVYFTGTEADDEAGLTLYGASHIKLMGLSLKDDSDMLEYGILISNTDDEKGSQHNTIQNIHITLSLENPHITNGIRVIAAYAHTTPGGSNSNNRFIDNHISNVVIAYYLDSQTGDVELMDSGNIIVSEFQGQHIMENLVLCGVYLLNQNGATVKGTHIRNLERIDDGTNTAPAAISATGGLPSNNLTNPFIIANNHIENHYSPSTTIFGMFLNQRNAHYDIYNNVLHNITTEGGGNFYASGIFLFATNITANIYNNMLSGISAPASGLANAAATRGIDVRSFNSANIYYNSVHLDYDATNPDNKSGALNIHNANSPVDIRNNIFVNTTRVPEGGNAITAAMFKSSVSVANLALTTDNNIYYAGTPSPTNLIFYGHHGSEPAKDETLEEYMDRAENFDQNSLTEDVPFAGNGDLFIDLNTQTLARGNAQPISEPVAITTDIYGNERNTESPDIGAHELTPVPPLAAANPSPAHLQDEVPVELAQLGWQFSPSPYFTNPEGFRIYLGTTENLEEEHLAGTVAFDIEQQAHEFLLHEIPLEHETTYYWRVVPYTGTENGLENPDYETWSFQTREADNTGLIPLTPSGLKIYPNPASGRVNIELDGQSKLQIIAMDGRVVKATTANGPVYSLQLNDIQTGIYIIKVTSGQHARSGLLHINP